MRQQSTEEHTKNNQDTDEIIKQIQTELFAMQDTGYRDFHSKLIPTIKKETIIGVRIPALRKYSKEMFKTKPEEVAAFMQNLPHAYYEENCLHAFFIEQIKEYGECVQALDKFLPFVDNWATCDMMSPKIFKKHLPELITKIRQWIASDDIYAVRFAMGMLMKFYLEEEFLPEYPAMVAQVQSQEYYIKMMVAWYFATALAKQYERVLPFLEENRLEMWTHNKTIQKAVESYRITPQQKAYLKTLKRRA